MTDLSLHLIEQIKTAAADGTPLCIHGNQTKAHLGRPSSATAMLSLSEHTGITAYNPSELYISALAGTPITEIQACLAEKNQTLAFEPAHFNGKGSIGGTIATNLSGPSRPWSGAGRDMVMGVKLINGLGEHLTFGGQVMKNVAGYDVSRLQAGAFGTLGVMTELSLKVVPIAETSLTLTKPMAIEDAIVYMNQIAGQSLPINGLTWVDGDLVIRLSGETTAVNAAKSQLEGRESDPEIWKQLREQTHPYFTGESQLWRFSIASDAPSKLLEAPWLIEWGGAQRWLRGDFDRDRLEQLAKDSHGSVSTTHATSAEEAFQQPSLGYQQLQKRIKASFDPLNIFNPSRLYSWM